MSDSESPRTYMVVTVTRWGDKRVSLILRCDRCEAEHGFEDRKPLADLIEIADEHKC